MDDEQIACKGHQGSLEVFSNAPGNEIQKEEGQCPNTHIILPFIQMYQFTLTTGLRDRPIYKCPLMQSHLDHAYWH